MTTTGPSDTIYDLCAVVQHHGARVNSGHYTCVARCPGTGTNNGGCCLIARYGQQQQGVRLTTLASFALLMLDGTDTWLHFNDKIIKTIPDRQLAKPSSGIYATSVL